MRGRDENKFFGRPKLFRCTQFSPALTHPHPAGFFACYSIRRGERGRTAKSQAVPSKSAVPAGTMREPIPEAECEGSTAPPVPGFWLRSRLPGTSQPRATNNPQENQQFLSVILDCFVSLCTPFTDRTRTVGCQDFQCSTGVLHSNALVQHSHALNRAKSGSLNRLARSADSGHRHEERHSAPKRTESQN